MANDPVLKTPRLLLRPLREADLAPLAALHADPRVMEFLSAVFDRAANDEFVSRTREHFAKHGFGRWGVEIVETGQFIGLAGLVVPWFETHFTPCVEIGWRLACDQWGKGYATEAARAALEFGFGPLGLKEIVSFTVPANVRSRRVMERLGMTHSPADDFDHPRLPEGHPLRRQVLYRKSP